MTPTIEELRRCSSPEISIINKASGVLTVQFIRNIENPRTQLRNVPLEDAVSIISAFIPKEERLGNNFHYNYLVGVGQEVQNAISRMLSENYNSGDTELLLRGFPRNSEVGYLVRNRNGEKKSFDRGVITNNIGFLLSSSIRCLTTATHSTPNFRPGKSARR